MSKITITIFEDAEAWLKENSKYMHVDNVSSVRRASPYDPDGITKYSDMEDDDTGTKGFSVAQHVAALQMLCEKIGRTLFVGCIKNPYDLTDFANWDVEVTDAFWQLVYHGEVIYG